jgi:carbohydrate-binding DOMON domain-containing protein
MGLLDYAIIAYVIESGNETTHTKHNMHTHTHTKHNMHTHNTHVCVSYTCECRYVYVCAQMYNKPKWSGEGE